MSIQSSVSGLWGSIREALQRVLTGIIKGLRGLGEDLIDRLGFLWDLLQGFIATAMGKILAFVIMLITVVTKPITEAIQSTLSHAMSLITSSPQGTFATLVPSHLQALGYVAVEYCKLDNFVLLMGSYFVLTSGCFLCVSTVWVARKFVSIVRGAGV